MQAAFFRRGGLSKFAAQPSDSDSEQDASSVSFGRYENANIKLGLESK